MDVLLVDFTGQVRQRWDAGLRFPDPDELLAEIGRGWPRCAASWAPSARPGAGRGHRRAAEPGRLAALLGLPPEWPPSGSTWTCAPRWGRDRLPVLLIKDTAAACVAELVAGRGRSVKSFLYIFVDTFIGGGLVLDSHLRAGAAATPAPWARCRCGWPRATESAPAQLLSVASLLNLEQRLPPAGLDTAAVGDGRALQAPWLAHTQAWWLEAAAAPSPRPSTAPPACWTWKA
jgi:hypothetical protein